MASQVATYRGKAYTIIRLKGLGTAVAMQLESFTDKSPKQWDNFVTSLPCGHFMQSHAWGVFQRSQGWESHYLVLREQETICGAVLLLFRQLPVLGGKVFYAPRGPVVDFTSEANTSLLLSGIKDYIKQKNGVFLRVDPYLRQDDFSDHVLSDSNLQKVSRDWSYWNAPKLVLWLDLQGDEETVFKRLNSGCRNEVRKGYRNGVQFSLGHESDLDAFYRLMVETGQHKGIAFHDFGYYRRLFAAMNASTKVQLFLGRYQGQVITAGVSVVYGEKAWLLYAASAPASYKLIANRTLQWEMIKWAHAQGCKRYDFRGTATSDPPKRDDPGYGVYKFKKSFGSEYTRMTGYYDLVSRPMAYRMLRTAEEKLLPTAYSVRTWLGERGKP